MHSKKDPRMSHDSSGNWMPGRSAGSLLLLFGAAAAIFAGAETVTLLRADDAGSHAVTAAPGSPATPVAVGAASCLRPGE